MIGLPLAVAIFTAEHLAKDSKVEWAYALIVYLLGVLVGDHFIERIQASRERDRAEQVYLANREEHAAYQRDLESRASRLQRLERTIGAATDGTIFQTFERIATSHVSIRRNNEALAHAVRTETHDQRRRQLLEDLAGLYDSAHQGLTQARDWLTLARRKIILTDPEKERPWAGQLILIATKTVDAIAVPNDLRYLDENEGRQSLEEQARRVDPEAPRRITIRRLFVYDRINHPELWNETVRVAQEHSQHGIDCRIYCGGGGRVLPNTVQDCNIIDRDVDGSAIVRWAEEQLVEGYMGRATISLDPIDVDRHSRDFDGLWIQGCPIANYCHPGAKCARERNGTTPGSVAS
jgi:hypothetical protein